MQVPMCGRCQTPVERGGYGRNAERKGKPVSWIASRGLRGDEERASWDKHEGSRVQERSREGGRAVPLGPAGGKRWEQRPYVLYSKCARRSGDGTTGRM